MAIGASPALSIILVLVLINCVQCYYYREREFSEPLRFLDHPDCIGQLLDIYFIVDSSTSIYRKDVERAHEFVRHVVSQLTLGDGSTRIVGVLAYSNDVQDIPPPLEIKEMRNKAQIVSLIALERLPYMTGRTATFEAIRYVRSLRHLEFRQSENVKKVIVVLTDGGSSDPELTASEADHARREGFYLYVVGVGSYLEQSEWRAIANDPDRDFIFNISDGGRALMPVVTSLLNSLCQTPMSHSSACNVRKAADLYFVAGPGGTSKAYELINEFVANTVQSSRDLLRVSYLFDHCKTTDNSLANVENYCGNNGDGQCQQYPQSSKTYQRLLKSARDHAKRKPRRSRVRNGNQVAVLFVDEESIIENWSDINTMKADGIEVIVVDLGIRNCFETFLREIPRQSENYIKFVARDSLTQEELYQRFITRICYAVNDVNSKQ